MKRILWGAIAFAVFGLVFQSVASAAAALELVTGSGANYSTLFVADNGAVTCSNFGTSTACTGHVYPATDENPAIGAVTVAGIVFGNFDITITTGGSNSPNCSGIPNGPGCINTTNINSVATGAGTVSMYFADTGFTPAPPGLTVGFSTPGETGATADQTAYATAGNINPLGIGVLNPTAGLTVCGSATGLTIPGPTGNTSLGDHCSSPGAPFSLELATTMTASAAGQAFNLNGTIDAVPEPTAVALFGTVLAICASRLRRKRQTE